jgi:hypothetical protein
LKARQWHRITPLCLLAAGGCMASPRAVGPDAPVSAGADASATGGSTGGTVGGTGGGPGGAPGEVDANPTPTAGPDSSVTAAGDATVAGSSDGGAAIGGPSHPCDGCVLFEGFEDATVGQPPDPAVWSGGGKAVVDSMHAARGGKALHILPILAGSTLIRETKTFPQLANAFYTRIFLWVDRQPVEKPSGLYHWTVIEASDNAGGGGKVIRLGGHIEGSGTNWLRFNYNTHTGAGETGLSDMAAVLEPKRWYCLEAYFNMKDQEARFWLDGMERPMLHWKANSATFAFPPAVQSLSFGWAEYQAPRTPFELWIDEIAVSAQPIGCDR